MSGRAKPGRKPKQSNALLYILLVLVAVGLGILIALVPGAAPDGESASEAEDPANSVTEAEGDTVARGGEADEAGPAPEGATERYPEGEQQSLPEAPQSDSEFWWLPPAVADGKPGRLYLILDDAGNTSEHLADFLEIPAPLAVAVLPQLRHSVESAARVAAAGKEIMLHQPMQPVGGANPGPGAVTLDMSDSEILRILDDNLATVPGAIGVNNHMGSAATADDRIMHVVLADLKRRDLFFVDSRTTVDTVSAAIAGSIQVRFAERDVFLDNERTRDAILASVRTALELAQTKESVVMIGHATVPELAAVLLEIHPILVENGYEFAPVSDLVRVPAAGTRDPS